MAVSTFRTDAVTNLMAVLQAFANVNPTLLAPTSVFRARPASFAGVSPGCYIGARDEGDTMAGQIWTRTLHSLEIVLFDIVTDNQDLGLRADTLVDAILSLIANNPHALGTDSVVAPTGVTDVDNLEGLGGVDVRRTIITLGQAYQGTGRG